VTGRHAPSLRELVDGATQLLREAGVGSPAHDARALAAFALGRERLVPGLDPDLDPGFAARFAALVERRRAREPLQRITGRTAFRYLDVPVADGVFVPRPETETVAEHAVGEARRVREAGRDAVVVDLCCGAGVIGASVALEVPGARVHAVDASPAAVDATRATAREARVALDVEVGDVRDAHLLAALDGAVDVVVANPPYIPPDAVPQDPEVRDHDPDLALYGGGADGLEVPRAVVDAAARLLRPGGLLVMEHAEVQAAAVRAELRAHGSFTQVTTDQDLTGRDRMVLARKAEQRASTGSDVEHSRS